MLIDYKIAKLTDQLNRYKRKAHNRRNAIKVLQRNAQKWEEIAQKYMALLDKARQESKQNYQVAWYIAKARAIELGLVSEEDCKHIRGVVKIREWKDAKIAEYELQNGQLE
jgi:hypothetical protein